MAEVVRRTRQDDGIWIVAMEDREGRNTFTRALVGGLFDAMAEIAADQAALRNASGVVDQRDIERGLKRTTVGDVGLDQEHVTSRFQCGEPGRRRRGRGPPRQ